MSLVVCTKLWLSAVLCAWWLFLTACWEEGYNCLWSLSSSKLLLWLWFVSVYFFFWCGFATPLFVPIGGLAPIIDWIESKWWVVVSAAMSRSPHWLLAWIEDEIWGVLLLWLLFVAVAVVLFVFRYVCTVFFAISFSTILLESLMLFFSSKLCYLKDWWFSIT